MAIDSPVDSLTRELAQYLESADARGTSRAAQKKHFKSKLQQLQPLRATALSTEIENFYNVGACYLLFGYPPKFPSWADPADNRVFAGSRHINALNNLKRLWKQPDTISKIRETLRDQIPVPTWPGRDFLDRLVKIAGAGGAGYPLDSFLVELPRFLNAKVSKVPKSAYSRREGRRCVLPSELTEFYDAVVQPWIVGALKPKTSSRKRQKSDEAGRYVNGSVRSEEELSDVELPRRSDTQEKERESSIGESSPEPESIQQLTKYRAAHGDGNLAKGHAQADESELEIAIEPSLVDDDPVPQDLTDHVSQTEERQPSLEQHPQMARRAKASKATTEEQAQQHVEDVFDNYLARASGITKGAQYLLDFAKERQSLLKRIEAATVAHQAANDAVAQVDLDVASQIPANLDLTQAIAHAEAHLNKFSVFESQIREHQKALEILADDMDANDMGIITTRTVFDDSALVARRTEYEQTVQQRKALAILLEEKKRLRLKTKKDLEALEVQVDQLETDRDETEELFRRLKNDDTTNAALARFRALMAE